MDRTKPYTVELDGAWAPIEVSEDALGVPHVRARSKRDAFFAQGYLVARDRLFQLDLDLRLRSGRMAEGYGASFLPGDRAARLFHYRGDMAAELAAIPPEVRDCVHGYVAGINARIAQIEADPEMLPQDFRILGSFPLRWDLRTMVTMRGVAIGAADAKIRRAMMAARGLLRYDHFVDPLRIGHDISVPDGLDCDGISWDDLGALKYIGKPTSLDTMAANDAMRAAMLADLARDGSNAWTVAGSRTASGRPILANDPHLSIDGFAQRHLIHLTAPGLDIMGAGNPGLPGIMQGHTDFYAFGRTNFHIDQTDVVILETRADNYCRNGEWLPIVTVEEKIAVRGAPDEVVQLHYCGDCPIISGDPASGRVVAIQSVSMLPGANMQFAIAAMNLARDWEELKQAFRHHPSPTNFHYADTEGNIGWHAIGFAPRRKGYDGLLPITGSGTMRWAGVLALEDMPSLFNPELGWIASANALNLPESYDFPLSYTWTDPFRQNRIAEVLAGQDQHSLADSAALMQDVHSLAARALVAMLPDDANDPAIAMLRTWDCNLDADSAAALLYEMMLSALTRLFREHMIPAEAREFVTSVNLSSLLDTLPQLGEQRNQLIRDALSEGWQAAIDAAGNDPTQWRWGDLHSVTIRHPFAADPRIAAAFPEISGGRSGGDATTVLARSSGSGGGHHVRHAACYQMITDVGEWDNSMHLTLPGQSNDAANPHYADFYPFWIDGAMQPMLFSDPPKGADYRLIPRN